MPESCYCENLERTTLLAIHNAQWFVVDLISAPWDLGCCNAEALRAALMVGRLFRQVWFCAFLVVFKLSQRITMPPLRRTLGLQSRRLVGARARRGVTNSRAPLRGKQGFSPREVTDRSFFAFNKIYFHVLRLPRSLFALFLLSSYLLISAFFAYLYYLDVGGLHEEKVIEWPSWVEGAFPSASAAHGRSTSWLTVFLYSFSISTNFPGPRVEANSLYTRLLGNGHALAATLLTTFWCGAWSELFSQPPKVIRWSSIGVIGYDRRDDNKAITAAKAGVGGAGEAFRVLTIRFDLLRPYAMGLINVKFELMCGKAYCTQVSTPLALVRRKISNISHGAVLQHVIDNTSPLFGKDRQSCRDEDLMLGVTMGGIEKNSMRLVFSEHLYSVYDGDILWDRAFKDQSYTDESGRAVYNFSLLDSLRAEPERAPSLSRRSSRSATTPQTNASSKDGESSLWNTFYCISVVQMFKTITHLLAHGLTRGKISTLPNHVVLIFFVAVTWRFLPALVTWFLLWTDPLSQ